MLVPFLWSLARRLKSSEVTSRVTKGPLAAWGCCPLTEGRLDGRKRPKPGEQRSKLRKGVCCGAVKVKTWLLKDPGGIPFPWSIWATRCRELSVAIGSEACSWSGTLQSVSGWASRAQNAGSRNSGMTPPATPDTHLRPWS